jgi:hypothetical protein
VFPGSFSLTDTTLVSLYSIKDTSFVVLDDFNFYNSEFNRTGVLTTTPVSYYIQITTNINGLCHPHPNANITDANGNATVDDVWSFDGAYFSDLSSNIDVSFNLPTIGSTRVELKDYNAYLMNDNSANVGAEWQYGGASSWTSFTDSSGSLIAKVFDLDVALSSNDQGVITGVTSFYDASGSGFNVRIPENIGFSQVLSLEYSNFASKEADPTTHTTDVLTYSINASQLNGVSSGDIKDKRNAVDALYTGQKIFSAWSVSFTAQDASGLTTQTYNTITNYARDKNWTSTTTGEFGPGDRIVATTPQSFSISITDKNNASVQLISPQNVYGVLRQSA